VDYWSNLQKNLARVLVKTMKEFSNQNGHFKNSLFRYNSSSGIEG
jgi:hypothetical protein